MPLETNNDDPIDRISPLIRPRRMPVMHQQWRNLLFLHWEVSPDLLRSLIPRELDIDTFEGRAYVGLVPFSMRGVRPKFLPSLPWLSSFHETNVRTYVHRAGRDPGVWFFSLDAANPVAVALARVTFGLPYFHARMTVEAADSAGFREMIYVSERHGIWSPPARSEVRAQVDGPVQPAVPGSIEHFLVERHLLYSRRGRNFFRGQVHHKPYPLQSVHVDSVDETLLLSSGITRPDTDPLAHFVSGVDVEVFGLTRLR